MSVADKLLQVNQVKQDIKVAIETKGIPMTNVAFTEYANKILDISDGGDVDEYFYYSKAYYTITKNSTLFENAWEHSLTVDPLEITATSGYSNPRGTAQYPNGETEGVIIPQGITSIGMQAFRGWEANNQPLIIPDSVTSIGDYAFYIWKSNTYPLVIPQGVTSLGNFTFHSWQSNNDPLVIPQGVTSIGNYTFHQWRANKHPIVIPQGVTSIGNQAFSYWVSAKEFIMESETPPTITSNSFIGTNNAPFYVPDESVDDYKTATNWVNLASRIFPISDK